jgi:hypothetical protein
MPSFRECWADFWQAIPKVKWPAGVCLDNMFQRSTGEGIERFENLCKILSGYFGGEAFPIASYEFAQLFGVSRKTIDRWRAELVRKGVLRLEENKCWKSGKAAVFSYFRGHVPQACIGELSSEAQRSDGDQTEAREDFLEVKTADAFEELRAISLRRRLEMGLSTCIT